MEYRDLDEASLIKLSESGDITAQEWLLILYRSNTNIEKITELAEKDWYGARQQLVEIYSGRWASGKCEKKKLIELAERGWENAQFDVASFYCYGIYGFPISYVKVRELAERGWKHAQKLVAKGWRKGIYGCHVSRKQYKICVDKWGLKDEWDKD